MLIRDAVADARMARSRGVADYWPQLLRYPLRGYSLPVLVMLSLFSTLAMGSTVGAGIPTTGLPLLLISLLLAVFYVMRIIDHTTRGYATPPPMGSEALYLAGILKPLVLPLLISLSLFALRTTRPTLAMVLLAIALFVLPLYLFIHATQERLRAAINPLRWLKILQVMGLTYLLPCLLLVLSALLLRQVSGMVGTTLLMALCAYLLFGTAHVLGYLGYQHHHALGLQVDLPDPDRLALEQAHQQQLQALRAQIQTLLMAGEEAAAVRRVESHPGGPLDAIRFFDALFQALLLQGTASLVHAAGRRLISLQLSAHQPARALDTAECCLDRHWLFAPATPQQLEVLLRQSLQLGFAELYVRLLKGAEVDAHVQEPAWAGVQYLRAQHQAEVRRDDAGALQLLKPLRAMIQHPQHAQFERTARTLEALLARSKL